MPDAPSTRLTSLDALRGFDMLWITSGGLLAKAMRAFGDAEPAATLAVQFDHAKWEGFHFEDLIFPMFVFIAGASLVFSLTKIVAAHGRALAARRIALRALILFVIGVFYSGGFSNGLDGVRWLVAEAVTAALHHGRQLWFGSERNIGPRTRLIAAELGVEVRVAR